MEVRCFRDARSGVWSLLRGDPAEQLEELRGQAKPADATLAKIWTLLRIGYNFEELLQALSLVRDLSWSSVCLR